VRSATPPAVIIASETKTRKINQLGKEDFI
jgi:hypothetical protein